MCTTVHNNCMYAYKTSFEVLLKWSFFINHITNVLTEVVTYCKSGHILLGSFYYY